VALIEHVEFAAKKVPQVFVCAKGAAVEIVSAAALVRLFLTVNVDAALVLPSPTEPKFCDAGEIVMGDIPVPVNLMVWVAGEALSVITMLPVNAPRAAGVKVTVMTQLLPAATEVPQVLVSAKLPLDTILVTLRAVVVLVLWSVTVWPGLVVPTTTEPNESEAGDRVTTWACAVSIAAARKKREVRSTRVGMCEERNGSFIQAPAEGK
jgi:hypothetical protein